jgi:hypothetical protein
VHQVGFITSIFLDARSTKRNITQSTKQDLQVNKLVRGYRVVTRVRYSYSSLFIHESVCLVYSVCPSVTMPACLSLSVRNLNFSPELCPPLLRLCTLQKIWIKSSYGYRPANKHTVEDNVLQGIMLCLVVKNYRRFKRWN